MALLLRADGTQEEVGPANGKGFTLEEVRTLVNGYVAMITIEKRRVLLVNEEGGPIGLPVNKAATDLLQASEKAAAETYGVNPRPVQALVGDVLVVERKEGRWL